MTLVYLLLLLFLFPCWYLATEAFWTADWMV